MKAVAKQADESYDDAVHRAAAAPLGRLSLPPEEKAARLRAKYAKARALLNESKEA